MALPVANRHDDADDDDDDDDGYQDIQDCVGRLLAEHNPPVSRRGRPKKTVASSHGLAREGHVPVAQREEIVSVGAQQSGAAGLGLDLGGGVQRCPQVAAQPAVGFDKVLLSAGLHSSSNLKAVMAHISNLPQQHAALDEKTLDLAQHLMHDKYHLASMVTKENILGFDRKSFRIRFVRFAAALAHMSVFHKQDLERKICGNLSGLGKLLYVEGCSYDETPMKTVIKHVVPGHPLSQQHVVNSLLGLPQDASVQCNSEIAKILQSDHKYAMLLKLPSMEHLAGLRTVECKNAFFLFFAAAAA